MVITVHLFYHRLDRTLNKTVKISTTLCKIKNRFNLTTRRPYANKWAKYSTMKRKQPSSLDLRLKMPRQNMKRSKQKSKKLKIKKQLSKNHLLPLWNKLKLNLFKKWLKSLKDVTRLSQPYPRKPKVIKRHSYLLSLHLSPYQYFLQINQATICTTLRSGSNNKEFTLRRRENSKKFHRKCLQLNGSVKRVLSSAKFASKVRIKALLWSTLANMNRILKIFRIFLQ